MLTRLNWEPLASRRRAARLLMFYKIHYGLVATPMPLDIKLHPVPTRVENSLAYHISPSSCDYHLYSFSPALFVTGTFFLKRSSGPLPLKYSGVWLWLLPLFFFPRTVRDWNILPEAVVRASSPEVFRGMITQSVSWYFTDNRCRESRPYHEEPLVSCFQLLFVALIA